MIGRTVIVDTRPKEIVGVLPRGFRIGNADADMIFPLAFDRARITLAGFNYQGVARLRPGVTIAQANADIARMVPIWMSSWPDAPGTSSRVYETWKIAPALRPLKEEVVGGVTDVLWVVMATIGLVMLIACANVANLLLVRAEVRQRELAVRAALGAGRGRIVRGLLVESMLLGLMGGALGVGLAYAGVRVLVAIGPANLPRLSEISLDARTFAFTAVLSLLSSVFFGLIPALKYTGPRITAALGSIGRTASVSRERHRVRSVLVVVQVAIALVLLVSAGLMIRTFQSLRTVEPGFTQPEHLQIMRIFVAASHSSGRGTRDATAERPSGQAVVDSGCDVGRVRERDAHGRVRPEPGRRELWRDPHGRPARLRVGHSASALVQIRLARFLPHGGHQVDCGPRDHVDGGLRPAPPRPDFRESCP